MSDYSGNLLKMRSENDSTVKYYLPVGKNEIFMNDILGRRISLSYNGQINCKHCGRRTKTSFSQGYCYPCFQTLPETDECVLHPEKCEAHLGISRDMEWSEKNCLQEHVVYLALTSALKVGVTRISQVPVRWIDQGAWKIVRLAQTPNRNLAGRIEVSLKEFMTDKTNWRHMLTNILDTNLDILMEKERIKKLVPDDLKMYLSDDNEIVKLNYPVNNYPQKITSLGFDKQPKVEGILTGIKGQYLILDDHKVINIRKYAGYMVEVNIS